MYRLNIKTGIALLCSGILFPFAGKSQQDAHYSQYTFNTLVINPAYAGSREALSLTGIYRNQWTGFEGAPVTATFSGHFASRDMRHGFGLSAHSDEMGVTSDKGLHLIYAFRIPLAEKTWLAMGLQGSLENYQVDYNGVRLDNPVDAALQNSYVNRFLPNAGTGIWFNTSRLYAGLSIPRLISSNLSPVNSSGESKRKLHYFGTAGYIFDVGDHLKIRPSVMTKYTPGTPLSADFNAALLISEKVWLGASWRTDHSWVFMTQWNITPSLHIGYSYDLSGSDLRTVQSGSHEIMLGADLVSIKNKLISPRYF